MTKGTELERETGRNPRIYSTSIPPPEDSPEDYIPGFRYASGNKGSRKSTPVTPLNEVVKDVVEKEIDVDESFPVKSFKEGFPPVAEDWCKSKSISSGEKENHNAKDGRAPVAEKILQKTSAKPPSFHEHIYFDATGNIVPGLGERKRNCCKVGKDGVICSHVESENSDFFDISEKIYTISDVVTLARSAVPQMRAIALGLLTNISRKVRFHEYGDKDCINLNKLLLNSNALICARLAIDDKHMTSVRNGLDLLLQILNSQEEDTWELIERSGFYLINGLFIPLSPVSLARFSCSSSSSRAMQSNLDEFNSPIDKSETRMSIDAITQMIRKDTVSGLLETDIITRISYLISSGVLEQCSINKCIILLIRISRHSKASCDKIMDTRSLLEFLVMKYLKIDYSADENRPDLDITLNVLKFLNVLIRHTRTAAKYLLDLGIISIIARFVCRVGNSIEPIHILLKMQVWSITGSILRYELAKSVIEDYYELIRDNINADLSENNSDFWLQEYLIKAFIPLIPQATHSTNQDLLLIMLNLILDLPTECTKGSSFLSIKTRCEFVVEYLKKFSVDDKTKEKILLFVSRNLVHSEILRIIKEFQISVDSLAKLSSCCQENTTNNMSHIIRSGNYMYGLGCIRREGLARRLLNISLICQEWAARAKLGHAVYNMCEKSPKKEELIGIIRHWFESESFTFAIEAIKTFDRISSCLNNDWIKWFLHGLGMPGIMFLTSWESPIGNDFLPACTSESIKLIIRRKVLNMLPLGEENKAYHIMTESGVFNELFNNPDYKHPLKVREFIKENTFSQAMLLLNPYGQPSSAKLDSFLVEGYLNNRFILDLPLGDSWPLCLLPRISAICENKISNGSQAHAQIVDDAEKIIVSILRLYNNLQETRKIIDMDIELIAPGEMLALSYFALICPTDLYNKEMESYLCQNIEECAFTKDMHTHMDNALGGSGNFYQLYIRALKKFKAESFGNTVYSVYVLFPLRADFPEDYALAFLSELDDVIHLFNNLETSPFHSLKHYNSKDNSKYDCLWFSHRKIKTEILIRWFKALASNSLKSGTFIRALAISYIHQFFFGSLSINLVEKLKPNNIEAITPIAKFILDNPQSILSGVYNNDIFFWKSWIDYATGVNPNSDDCSRAKRNRDILNNLIHRCTSEARRHNEGAIDE